VAAESLRSREPGAAKQARPRGTVVPTPALHLDGGGMALVGTF
jgi:hypothetical protein